ncbi:4-alpha-glucanotransferase activity protein [Homalodisca vitripennis]|nr:4-alpha-glucanotransferase activity protein [Homalodisca vitripennis]
MIHFTPIQELGASNSAYSLQNQLGLNPSFAVNGHTPDIHEVEQLTNKLRNEWKMLTICDIVLNHTANESPWLREHPECTYNLVNCPHLKPAYLLDLTLYKFSLEVAKGMWEFSGVPPAVNSEEHLQAIRHAMFGTILPRVRIPELYLLNVHAIVDEFQRLARNRVPPLPTSNPPDYSQLKLVPDPQFRRLHATVDLELALRLFNVYRSDCFDEDTRLRRCTEEFKRKLEELNEAVNHKIQGHLVAAVENCIAGMRYFRVQGDGPRIPEVTAKDPLVPRYFTDADESLSEDVMYSSNACYVMAHNGWVMNADPLANFASPESNIYLRRELIAWGDSVKLRYGEKPEDCPFLWQHMQAYVDQMAQTFDGIRLDNCHSTPLVVAEYLLDSARRVRPNLFVAAELFTNSDQTDNIFVNRLGITSLIREAMSAWDSHELGRLVYRYGGVPVGAFLPRPDRPLAGGVAHALFLDLTHDNPCPLDKRSVFDSLPSAALVAMACCASGSNMGYDMLVPHHIHVVDESREYLPWADDAVNINTGIVAGKRALNNLHYQLGKNGFDQVFVDQVTEDVVCVTRHSATSRETVVLVAFTGFHPDKNVVGRGVTVSGNVDYIILEASLAHSSAEKFSRPTQFEKDPKKINGLTEYELSLRENFKPSETTMLEIIPSGDGGTRLNFTNKFKPGCVVAVKLHSWNLEPCSSEEIKKNRRQRSSKLILYIVSISETPSLQYIKCSVIQISGVKSLTAPIPGAAQEEGSQTSWRYEEWDARIANNFESQFWVPSAPTASEERPDLVNRRGIYKDSVGATQPWTDYQLRPNFTVAMVVAPELFLTSNAWQALKVAEEHLLGPLGMKTLDPSDWAYCGDYNNDNQSSDPKVAHGFNYHQGPEWVWPIGFFLRARLHFAELQGGAGCLARTIAHTHAILARHYSYLQNSPWRGLPELTNSNGTFCAGSCATQAWSMGCVLEVLEKLQSLERSLGDHGN